jgi:hypothetical protein
MTKDEALIMCLEYIEKNAHERKYVRHAIKAAIEVKNEPDYKELWQQMCERCDSLDKKLAQRTWVGLTNDEVNNFAAGCHLGNSVQGAIYKAEAKLKEKNNG